MSDLLSWSLDLGQWRGVRVRVHLSLILFLVLFILGSAVAEGHPVARTIAFLSLFVLALGLHELGHAVGALVSGNEPDDVLLWPLGNMITPPAAFRAPDSPWIPAGGVLVSGSLALGSALVLALAGGRMEFRPFGDLNDSGAPFLYATGAKAVPFVPLWWLGWFGWLNWVLFLLNVIPALPLDGGRTLRAILIRGSIQPRDSLIAPLLARACAVLLAVIGLFRLLGGRGGDFLTLILLAVLILLYVRLESRMYDDGGEYEKGAFGYDFSEGYTSLESSAAKVRPYRESAVARWRRKRSELRRQRRQSQEAAEERRLDEILDKLHRLGKPALSDEENRFLVRVSARMRGKTKVRP